MSQKSKISKDKFLETLAGNKLFLATLLILVLIARHYSRTLLNLPSYFTELKFAIAMFFALSFLIYRAIKHKQFYINKLKFSADIIILVLHFIFLSGAFWLIMQVTLSFIIVKQSDNDQVLTYNCKIVTVYTINADRIEYKFKGKTYIMQSPYGQDPDDIKDKYYVQISVNKSAFNSYILISSQLSEKRSETVYN
jgi:hypothetical protein